MMLEELILAGLARQIVEENEMKDETGSRVAAMLETCPEASKAKYTRMAEKAAGRSYASAVRLKCMECCCWSPSEVEQCAITGCALHGFRSSHAKRRRRGAVQESNDSTGDSTGG